MTRTELIAAVAERTGLTKIKAAHYVEATLDVIRETVAQGESVVLTGFGTFERRQRPAREFHNPATGRRDVVPATYVPKWKPGTSFRDAVRGRAA